MSTHATMLPSVAEIASPISRYATVSKLLSSFTTKEHSPKLQHLKRSTLKGTFSKNRLKGITLKTNKELALKRSLSVVEGDRSLMKKDKTAA